MSDSTSTRYAIVGAGIAGIAAIEAIREVDADGSILLVNGETTEPYCRPLIIEALTGERTRAEIALRDEDWYAKHSVSLIEDRATGLDPAGRTLDLASGRTVAYEKLLVATGSAPARPPVPGLDDIPAHSLFSMADADAVRTLCRPGGKALVLGLGLIGLQAVQALRHLDMDVTAVEMEEKILPLILDRQAAGIAARRMEAHGVEVRTGTRIIEFLRRDGEHPYAARTDSGELLGFNVLILATGMRPMTDLLEGTGVATGRAVQVKKTMETTVPGVYAAGDVTEYYDWIEGHAEIHAHWVNAFRQGRVAGLHMAGAEAAEYRPTFLNSLKVFGLPVVTVGASRLDETGEAEVYLDDASGREAYRRFVVRDGRLVAATFVGDVDQAGMIRYLVQEHLEVGDLARSIMEQGREGMEFLADLHREEVRGDVEWAPSMDRIDHYKKDMKHTRWGGEGKGA